jgi:hypothetical protein
MLLEAFGHLDELEGVDVVFGELRLEAVQELAAAELFVWADVYAHLFGG